MFRNLEMNVFFEVLLTRICRVGNAFWLVANVVLTRLDDMNMT